MCSATESMIHTFEGRLLELDSNVWGRFIDVPLDISNEILKRENRRLVAEFNGQLSKHCTILSHGDGTYFIMLNKQEAKKLGVDIGGMVNVVLKEDVSKYGMPMPEEMEELLRQDPEAEEYFHGLTPGKQRSLLYIIGKPQRERDETQEGHRYL